MLIALFTGDVTEQEYRHAASEQLAVSDIVLWELAKLAEKRRLAIAADSPEFADWLRALTVLPITWEIARQSTELDFSSDPADEIIAATSIVEKIPLLTRNRRIRKSKMVPLAVR